MEWRPSEADRTERERLGREDASLKWELRKLFNCVVMATGRGLTHAQ